MTRSSAKPLEYRLRRAEPGDASALSLVAGATFLEAYCAFMPVADLLAHLAAKSSPDQFARWVADPARIVTIAEAPAGAAPLGYAVVQPCDLPVPPREGDLELLRIYALATRWGSGLGAALMERAIADARLAGAKRLLLGTHPENFRAQAFYAKHGFAVVGRRRFQVGDSVFDDPVYARDL